MTLLALAMATTLVADRSFKLGAIENAALPYVIAYTSCFMPDSEMGQKIVTQLNVPAGQLPVFCRENRARWFDGAIAAMKKTSSHDMLQRTRQLETVFSNIERNNPIAETQPQNPTQ